ncbi:MAG TPA: saccharopine dehydrogenase, partial [Jatrophihabitantaceae bacterium]|nr:saccharopine dehydrogenase [Jatrophihabitantaceae bacterium]
TAASALLAFSRPRANMHAARERKALEVPPAGRHARAVPGRLHRNPVEDGWAVPLPTIDPQVVARSARAVDRYGPDFRYSHFVSVAHLPTALGAIGGAAAVIGLAQVPPARRVIQRRVVQPGAGPSAEKRAHSWFTVTFVGEGGGRRVVTRVSGGDPGYDETAKMLAESALALAFDDLPKTAGQVTPAAAMGEALLARLQQKGIRFEVLSK